VLRAAPVADVDAVVAVMNAESVRLTGRPDVNAEAVRGWWTQPAPFDLRRDVVLAVANDAVVGYGDLDETVLLTHAFAVFQERGLPRAGLGVDAENTTGAVALYGRAGMSVVRRHDTRELAL
jgi:hypothetical protein